MIKKAFEISIFVLFILLFNSCEYEPTGVYNQPVDQNIASPQIQVIELNINSDSIYLYSDMNVKFIFNSYNQKIKSVRFLIDGIEKNIINSNNGEFHIWFAGLKEGIHEMVIEIYTESGTGSIADKIGAEAFVASKSWKLIIDKSFHPTVKASAKKGLLNITWTAFRATNFKEYVIYRYDGLSAEKEILRTQATEYVDSTYVGEGAEYKIKVKTINDDFFMLGYLRLDPEIPKLNFYADNANQIVLKWGRGNYYNAADSFLIFQGSSSLDCQRVKSTHNIMDTVCQITSAGFGDQLYLKLRIVPKKNNNNYTPRIYSKFESWTYKKLGYQFSFSPIIYEIFPVKKDEFVYITNCDSVIRYSVSQKKVVEKLGHNTPGYYCCEFNSLKVSPSGNYLTSRIGCNSDVLFTMSNNFSPYSKRDLDYIFGHSTSEVPVSDVGTGLFCDYINSIYIYDFLNSKVIGHYQTNYNSPQGLKISSNGDYFFARDDSLRLIRFKDLQFKSIWSVPKVNNIKLYEFNPLFPNQVIFWNGNTLCVKQCDNLSTINEYTMTENLLDVDYYNKEILTYKSGHLYVRSFTDGSFIKDIPINFTPTGSSSCYLINHTIVSTNGLLYFL